MSSAGVGNLVFMEETKKTKTVYLNLLTNNLLKTDGSCVIGTRSKNRIWYNLGLFETVHKW